MLMHSFVSARNLESGIPPLGGVVQASHRDEPGR